MKNLLSRTLTGAVYIAVIVAGLMSGPMWFMLLSCLLAALGVHEFLNLAAGPRNRAMTLLDIAGALVTVTGIDTLSLTREAGDNGLAVVVWGLIFLTWLVARIVAQLYSHNPEPLRQLACSMTSLMWIALPLGLMGCIYSTQRGDYLMLGVFILLWINDTGAYLVGSRIGRHRLFERLSPKKSWEGFFGGLVLSVAAAWGMAALFPEVYGLRGVAFMLGLGVVVPVFGTWGDLAESMVKRTLHVKDSGHILPGHGGILDRIDSLLLAAPATLIYMAAWRVAGFVISLF